MDDGIAFVDPEDEIDLFHYASKYYDPVKAKEYYERTKKLKGRKSAPALSKESREKQSQATAYVREQIRTQREKSTKELTAKGKALSAAQKAKLEALRTKAQATRERIVKALQDKVKKLLEDVDKKVPKPKLNEIPASASPRQREYLEKQNAKLMQRYNKELNKERATARDAAGKARDQSRAEAQKVGTDLKTAVNKIRTDYKAARQALSNERKTTTAKYQKDLQTELKNIQDKVR